MSNKGQIICTLRDVPATGQAIADAIVKITTEAGALFTNPTVVSISFSPAIGEGNPYAAVAPSVLNVTIQEG